MPTSRVIDDDIALAARLAATGAALAADMARLGRSGRLPALDDKWVSEADVAVETMCADHLRRARPGDGILGEEGGLLRSGERRWLIDPIDGTHNYIWGTQTWCTAVGLEDDTGPLAGAVAHPSSGDVFAGGRGVDATCNGDTLPTLRNAPVSTLSIATTLSPDDLQPDELSRLSPLLRVLSSAGRIRVSGSASIDQALVASGRLGATIQRDSSPWDWCPGAALVASAGGSARTFEHDGHTWYVSGNVQAVDQIEETIRRG